MSGSDRRSWPIHKLLLSCCRVDQKLKVYMLILSLRHENDTFSNLRERHIYFHLQNGQHSKTDSKLNKKMFGTHRSAQVFSTLFCLGVFHTVLLRCFWGLGLACVGSNPFHPPPVKPKNMEGSKKKENSFWNAVIRFVLPDS